MVKAALYRVALESLGGPARIIQAARRNQELVTAIKGLVDAWALFTQP
jgi:hypothetical protein